MERRTPAAAVARNVSSAITAAGMTPAVVAEATDIPLPELEGLLRNEKPFELPALVSVGGFLHVSPISFLNGAAA
jgi:hypothetical protein